MIEGSNENQTQFMEDQALWQRPAATQFTALEQSHPSIEEVTVQKKKLPPKIMMLIAAGVIVILTILLMMIAGIGRKNLRLMPESSPLSTPTTNTMSDLDKALNRLNQDVIAADPTVNDLPFPPLNPELYIVPKRN